MKIVVCTQTRGHKFKAMAWQDGDNQNVRFAQNASVRGRLLAGAVALGFLFRRPPRQPAVAASSRMNTAALRKSDKPGAPTGAAEASARGGQAGPGPKPVSRALAPVAAGASAGVHRESTEPVMAGEQPEAAESKRAAGQGDFYIYALLVALVVAAWQVTELKLFESGDDFSYWIAVFGGSMMLVLFAYPLRKHFKFMRGLGKVKWWFWFHLTMGVVGPWLILVHSTFRIGSLNAGVALYSMVIVVLSGVIGRFIHVRVHRGLDGEKTSLRELRARAGMIEGSMRSRLHFAPQVEERLLAFEQHELRSRPGWLTYLRQVSLLPVQQWVTYAQCVLALRAPLRQRAQRHAWTAQELKRRERRARSLVDRYLVSVVRVAQYAAFERLFALWHVAHLPFVYLLVISAVVHVIAVHAY